MEIFAILSDMDHCGWDTGDMDFYPKEFIRVRAFFVIRISKYKSEIKGLPVSHT